MTGRNNRYALKPWIVNKQLVAFDSFASLPI
jgi:hypothetical protein